MTEVIEYRSIKDFPGHRVGSDGSIWSCLVRRFGQRAVVGTDWRKLIPAKVRGYPCICLARDGKRPMFKIHRLVLEAFAGPCPEGFQGCHNNGQKDDNRIENLRWDTPKANQYDRRAHGTHREGENHPSRKLSASDVRFIFDLAQVVPYPDVAEVFGVCRATVSHICNGRIWRNLCLTSKRPTSRAA